MNEQGQKKKDERKKEEKTKAPKHNANRRNTSILYGLYPSVCVTMLFLWVEQITFCFPLDVF